MLIFVRDVCVAFSPFLLLPSTLPAWLVWFLTNFLPRTVWAIALNVAGNLLTLTDRTRACAVSTHQCAQTPDADAASDRSCPARSRTADSGYLAGTGARPSDVPRSYLYEEITITYETEGVAVHTRRHVALDGEMTAPHVGPEAASTT